MSAPPEQTGSRERETTSRVLIVGAGHAGLLLALALERSGIAVRLVEAQPLRSIPDAPFTGRALALMYGSKRVFDALGLWSEVGASAEPVQGVRVVDGVTGAQVAYEAAEVGDHPFAFGIEDRHLRAGLLRQARARPRIEISAPARLLGLARSSSGMLARLDDGRTWRGELVVGADGRDSVVRALAGIGLGRWDYRQTALTFAVRHEHPHEQRVREYLRPPGPLALLPIGPRLCSVTWVERSEDARCLLGAGPEGLRAALHHRIGGVLGGLRIEGAPAGYPLAAQEARRCVGPRIALIGDAARGVHPIHAQGFNLGVRDVAALSELVAEAARDGSDLGDSGLLLRYERWRRADVRLVLNLTDGLNRLFSNDLAPAKLVRSLGLAAIDRLGPLKHLAMRRGMGLAGDLPKLARGETL